MTLPSAFKATIIPETGDFDVIKKVDIPFQKPDIDEVVIKLSYGGVNFLDNHIRSGTYPVPSMPYRFGLEGSGVVVALPSDPSVLQNEDFVKRGFKIGSKVVFIGAGAYSEYVAHSWQKVFPIPDGVSLRVAAAIHGQGVTAVSFVEEAYNVKPGDTILVHTVAGGLGLLFTQLIKLRGGIVIGTTSTPEKAEVAKAYGADHVILYRSENVAQRVLEITKGEGVHAIFDGVGKDTYEIDFKVIRRKGVIVFLGMNSGDIPPIMSSKLVEKNVFVGKPTSWNYLYTPEESQKYCTELYNLVLSQKLKVLIHKEYPFTVEGIQESGRDLLTGKTFGKLLIKIADEPE